MLVPTYIYYCAISNIKYNNIWNHCIRQWMYYLIKYSIYFCTIYSTNKQCSGMPSIHKTCFNNAAKCVHSRTSLCAQNVNEFKIQLLAWLLTIGQLCVVFDLNWKTYIWSEAGWTSAYLLHNINHVQYRIRTNIFAHLIDVYTIHTITQQLVSVKPRQLYSGDGMCPSLVPKTRASESKSKSSSLWPYRTNKQPVIVSFYQVYCKVSDVE